MRVFYAHERPAEWRPPHLFLAGPSPREAAHLNWRLEALTVLQELHFRGSVFVPLPRNGNWAADYDAQVEWELMHLDDANVIAFWIPRDLENLPGFTTNVEFGLYGGTGKCVLGYPEGALKMRYLDHLARKRFSMPVAHTLRDTLVAALELWNAMNIPVRL